MGSKQTSLSRMKDGARPCDGAVKSAPYNQRKKTGGYTAKIGNNPDFSIEKNPLYFRPAILENRCCAWLGSPFGQAEKEVRVKIVYPNLPDTQKKWQV